MLRLFIFLVAIIAAALADLATDIDRQWATFKTKHNKKYGSLEIEKIRKSIWMENKDYIDRHGKLYSQGRSSFFMDENEHTDLTLTEIHNTMTGMTMVVKNVVSEKQGPDNRSLPDSVDWRTKGYVTAVKHQGMCNSGWAFSAIGSMEGQHFKKTGRLVSLSESNLVDCSYSFGNMGCKRGQVDTAFMYVILNKGINTENSYPYNAFNGEGERCHFNRNSTGATFTNFTHILPRGSEAALQKALAEVGPISICIDASRRRFFHYKGGIYDDPQCSATRLTHAVLLVGYGTDSSGTPYWLVKNSWGTSWGMDGYMMMRRNRQNQCGVASYASYPLT